MADMNFMGSPLAVAVTAAILSPRVRQVLHRGAVHSLAGVLSAGDAVTSFARGVGRGLQEASVAAGGPDPVQQPVASATEATQKAAQEANTEPKATKARKTATKPKTSPKAGEGKA